MTAEPLTILVCDDNDVGRYTKVRPLKHAGFRVIEAATGREALRLMAEHRPPLAVMDVKLPDISGLEVTAAIKRDFPGTFVLQTSASFVTLEDRIRGLEEGADSYLIQPMEPRELVAGVRALLRIREAESALKASRAAQAESENRSRQILESATDFAIIATDLDGVVTTWNVGARNILGWDEAEMLGQSLRRIWTPEDRAAGADRKEVDTARAQGRAEDQRWHMRKDGSRFWGSGLLMTLKSEGGELVGFLKILRDQTRQREADAALQDLNATLEGRVAERTAELAESQRRFRGIFDSALQFMALLFPDGTVAEVNRTALDWSRIEPADIVGRPFWLAVPMRDNPALQAAIQAGIRRAAAGETVREEHEMRGAGEVRAIVDFSLKPVPGGRGEPIWLVAEGRDITALKQAQDQLRQAQKMEAVGQLTGGVAHDFNNLLTIIKSSTDLLRRPDLAEARRRRYVDAISDTVDRAARLTGQLLAFARRQALKPEVFDAAERIGAIADMMGTIVGSRIRIETNLSAEPCFVEADRSQFETALVNMAVNARDAMSGEGALSVTVEALTAMPPIRGHGGGPGRFVAVSLSDTGAGIPPDTLAHIFEPFFTTKEVGKGTGLGLSQVFGFAKQSGGDVDVRSEVGRGTTFTLYLPRADRAAAADVLSDAGGLGPAENGRGRRVLVVEDNVEVGAFSTQILQDLGYETALASNAEEALRRLAEEPAFDAVFSDVVMPGLSGVELGQEIRRRHPGLPVVLTSGYSHVLAEEGRHGFELLQKPYAAEELSRVLRRATARGRAQSRRG